MEKSADAFRTISEVAVELDLPQHVLRFWETRFAQIRPLKRGGGRRYYRPDDLELLRGIRHLLYGEGYTIKGVQRILREQGVHVVMDVWKEGSGVVIPNSSGTVTPVGVAPDPSQASAQSAQSAPQTETAVLRRVSLRAILLLKASLSRRCLYRLAYCRMICLTSMVKVVTARLVLWTALWAPRRNRQRVPPVFPRMM